MLQRVVAGLTLTVAQDHRGLTLQVSTRCIESSSAHGRVVYEVDRYDCMTPAELADVIDTVLHARAVGTDLEAREEEMTLFAIS